MSATEKFWKEDFGNSYHQRNRVDWRARVPFWKEIIETTGARSAFEFGCGPGWNLSAIKRAVPDVEVYGHEINGIAEQQAEYAGLQMCSWEPENDPCPMFDLVFTAGCLIHIPPKDLESKMKGLVESSADYVLAIEYASDKEEMIDYRGHSGKLWRRPYGQMYLDMGLNLVKIGDAGPGFDDCTFWLMRK